MSDSAVKDHVRLKPLSPAAGQTKRDYSAPWGFTYKAGIWYVEPESVAAERSAYLAMVRMNSSDDYSPKAFNVCTREEAARLKLYEESNELEQVMAASRPAIPPAPLTEAPAAMSEDLNLPAPKSELAAAAHAAAEEAEAARRSPPPEEAPPPTATNPSTAKTKTKKKAATSKPKSKPRSRRRNPGS